MRRLLKIFKQENGFALPLALLLIFIASVVVTPIVWLVGTNLKTDMAMEQKVTGTYAADSGIQYALYQFTNGVENETYNPGDPISFPDDNIQGFDVNLQVVPVGGTDYKITSTATNPQTDQTSQIVAFVHGQEQGEVGPTPFHYALATLGGDLVMTGSAGVTCVPPPPPYNGDVWINGNINKGWSNYIQGTATLTGTVIGPNPGSIYTIEDNADPCPRPTWLDDKTNEYIDSTYVAQPSLGGTCGSWTDVATVYNNPVCVNNDMTLSKGGTYRFKDTVWVKGNLNIQSGANDIYFEKSVRVDGNVNLIGSGTVNFLNNIVIQDDSIPYNNYSLSSYQGTAIQVLNYNSSAVLTVESLSKSESLAVKLQDSDDGMSWADVPGGAFPNIIRSNSNTTYKLDYNGGKKYLRAFANSIVTGDGIYFGVVINRRTPLDNVLYIGGYLNCGGSRSALFEGKVSVNGASTYSGYTIYFDGGKYWASTFDVEFDKTIRTVGNVRFGSGRGYEFDDAIYTTGNYLLDGNAQTMNYQPAIIADGNITIQGSSSIGPSDAYETAPFIISRKIGCCTDVSSCNPSCDGVCLTGDVPVTSIVYAPDSRAYVSGSSQFIGAMVAKCARLDGSAVLKYPVVLDDREDLEGTTTQEGSTFTLESYSIK
jgi:hypothetical protein